MRKLVILFVMIIAACSSNNESISIDPLKEYAVNYPVASQQSEMMFTLQELPPDVENIINKRVIDDEFKLYVSLILARHYRGHITYANQSYLINKKHPLWKVFEKFSKIDFQSEYELSSVIYNNWLHKKQNLPPLLKVEYEAINKELLRIENQSKELEAGY